MAYISTSTGTLGTEKKANHKKKWKHPAQGKVNSMTANH
jgi:hypothetical protein